MKKHARNFGKTTFCVGCPRAPFEIPKFPDSDRHRIHPPNSSFPETIGLKPEPL